MRPYGVGRQLPAEPKQPPKSPPPLAAGVETALEPRALGMNKFRGVAQQMMTGFRARSLDKLSQVQVQRLAQRLY